MATTRQPVRTEGWGRRVAPVVAGLILGVGAGCAPLVRGLIQQQLNAYWRDPAKRAVAEDRAEQELRAGLDEDLVGAELEVTGPNPYVHHIAWLTVDIGQDPIRVGIPGSVQYTQTDTHYYLRFDWDSRWEQGNGARVDMRLDLRTHSFWTAYEYPDHTVRIRDVRATADGGAVVVIPKKSQRATSSLTVRGAHVDLRADAEGWFWTVNISKDIKKRVNDQVVRRLVGKAFELAFDKGARP